MDQHPIPQDVTGFQFKLIGTMTVKQFGYVASGVVMAVILYYLPLNSAFGILLKVLFVPLFGASGVIIAFVPLEGRPIDVMTTNFVKALFSPNQYIYHRQGRKLSFTTVTVAKAPVSKKAHEKNANHLANSTNHHDAKEEKLQAFLLSSHSQTKNALDKKETAFLNTLSLTTTQNAVQTNSPSPVIGLQHNPLNIEPKSPHLISTIQPIPQTGPSPAPAPIQNEKPEENLQKPVQPQSPIPPPNTALQPPGQPQHVTVLSQQINAIHAQKQQLEQEITHLRTQLASQKAASTPPAQEPIQDPQHVRVISQDVSKKVGLPHVSDSPNVVVGIVKDPRENILANILVEVKDKDGNPVRAFKTNQLGQFASATPLSPGAYTIELEDPKKQHQFDQIQIVANNQILSPIEVISHDAREELRKQLFAN
jgi:hypothetical protein